jgi:long-chain acyl-CoA synthetase
VSVEVANDAPALLVGSSGGGGRLFNHSQLVAGAAQLRSWLTDAMPGDDTWLQLAPMWTALGFVAGLGTAMALRARLALLPNWEAADVLDALRYLRPAYVLGDRDAAERIAATPDLSRADLRSVRAWLVGDVLTDETVRAFRDLADVTWCQGYSPPGAAGFALCNPVNGQRAAGSIGIPLPDVEVRVVDDEGAELPAGGVGRLVARGPNLAADLPADPAADGWCDCPMQARIDGAGFVYPAG